MDDVVIVQHNDELYPEIAALRQHILYDPHKSTLSSEELESDKRTVHDSLAKSVPLHSAPWLHSAAHATQVGSRYSLVPDIRAQCEEV